MEKSSLRYTKSRWGRRELQTLSWARFAWRNNGVWENWWYWSI